MFKKFILAGLILSTSYTSAFAAYDLKGANRIMNCSILFNSNQPPATLKSTAMGEAFPVLTGVTSQVTISGSDPSCNVSALIEKPTPQGFKVTNNSSDNNIWIANADTEMKYILIDTGHSFTISGSSVSNPVYLFFMPPSASNKSPGSVVKS